ncbi:MAG TPA: CHAT domain-containing tetratricopeptide repeat protein [Lacipirellulaceae bacterium]|nr:CHAT domain-containing tetratricopeptide repeat protein [Lacipirellulaceae bacterium]
MADLIGAHPELLSPEVDAELARCQETINNEGEWQRLAVARRVLELCRQEAGKAGFGGGAFEVGGASASTANTDPLAFLRVAEHLATQFSSEGVLGAALSVSRGLVLSALMGSSQADLDEIREAALAALEPLPVLWKLKSSVDLARVYGLAAALWAQRLRGDRGENQKRAIDSCELALTVLTREANTQSWAAMQDLLANVYRECVWGDRGENQERAFACYSAALSVSTPEADLQGWARTQGNLGSLYLERVRGDRRENQEAAIANFETALNVFTRDVDARAWAGWQNNLGSVYGQRAHGDRAENLERAIACFEAALTVSTRELDPHGWAQIQDNLGNAYAQRMRGDHSENQERALVCFESALSVSTPEIDPHGWAWIQHHLGTTYRKRVRGDRADNQERALACFEKALSIRTRETDPRRWAETQNNLANVYWQRLRGDPSENQERALHCFEAALSIITRDADAHGWALTQHSLSNVYRLRLLGDRDENLERAIACSEAALLVRTHEADAQEWAQTQLNLGNAYSSRKRGRRDENQDCAIACYEAALTVFTPETDPQLRAQVQNNLGIAYQERERGNRGDNQTRAIAHFESAIAVLRRTDATTALGAAAALGSLQLERGRMEPARAAWRVALDLRERLMATGTGTETRDTAAQVSQNLAARLALLEAALGQHQTAVATLERGRALALREALALDEIWLAGLPPQRRSAIRAAQQSLAQLRANPPLPEEGSNPGRVLSWEASMAEAERELDAAHDAAGYRPVPSLDTPALAALPPSGGAIVLLAAAEECGGAYILPAGVKQVVELHHVRLPGASRPTLRNLLIRWVTAYGAIPRSGKSVSEFMSVLVASNAVLEDVLEHLWHDVVGPIVRRLGDLGIEPGAELVLLPQGDLVLLPLHAAGPRDGRCILDDYVIRYAPSGYALQTAQERLAQRREDGSAGQNDSLFGVFNPMAGSRDALPFSDALEMRKLAEVFALHGKAVSVHAGQSATVERILTEAGGAGYVHLSCHGGFNGEKPERSGLQLAGDARLTVMQIVRDLRLPNCRLAVLSACESGVVDVQHQPDEFVGLPAAFLQAGAPGVAATFWSVLDGPTALLMPQFYTHHLQGTEPNDEPMRPAAALRKAVLWLRGLAEVEAGELRDVKLEEASEGEQRIPTIDAETWRQLGLLASSPIVWAAYAYHGA